MAGPLAGAVVVEVSSGWSAAAVTSTILADLGAEAYQVNVGCRDLLDPRLLAEDSAGPVRRWAEALDRMAARGKITATLDEVESLLAAADFLVVDDDGHQQIDDRLGWGQLHGAYPDVVACAVTNFGLTGPLSGFASTELTAQAASGVLGTTGHAQTGPLRVGFPLGQQATAMNATTAMIAVWRKRGTNQSRTIDAAVFDTFVAYLSTFLDNFVAGQVDRDLLGNHHPLLCPWNTYGTADGPLVICIPTDTHWRRLFDLITAVGDGQGIERDWLTRTRLEQRKKIDLWVESWTATRATTAALQALGDEGIPCAAVLDLADALRDDALEHRQLVKDDDRHGTYSGLPFRIRPL